MTRKVQVRIQDFAKGAPASKAKSYESNKAIC